MEFHLGRLFDITEFAGRINQAAADALETGDLESFNWYGDLLISYLEKFPNQRYAILEVLSLSKFELVRAEACWALDSAYSVNPKGTLAIWEKLLDDPEPRVAGAAVRSYRFATQPEPGERKTLKWRHAITLKPHVKATIARLEQAQ